MRKTISLIVLAISVLAVLPGLPNQPDIKAGQFLNSGPIGTTDYPWTMFHYDAVRDGVTPASGPASATLMWTYTTGNLVYPSPVVADGYVFIPSYDGVLYALDEYSGSLLWSFPTGGNVYGSPAVANGMVYVPSKNSYIYALNEQTGSVVWEIANDNLTPVTSSPVIADSKLFYGTFEAPGAGFSEVLSVNPQTGGIIWKYDVPGYYVQAPASVSNGRVFVGVGLNVPSPALVIALNETGNPVKGTTQQLWNYSAIFSGTPVLSISTAPVAAYGNVYVGLDSAKLIALNQITGSLVWSFNTPGGSNATTPAVYNGAVYFGTGGRVVYALNATTGALIWSRTTGGAVTSSPALSLGSNILYVGSNDHYLYALSTTTGAVIWRYLTGGQVSSSPAVADGRVFFGSKDQKVYALGAAAPKLFDSITASPAVLLSGQNSTLTITVRNSTAPQSGAVLTLASSRGGTFTQPVAIGVGVYQANFTSPVVSSSGAAVITVTASLTGYLSAVNQTSITVNPLPILSVVVSPKPSSITPGGEITLLIRVTNGTLMVPGARLDLSSSAGGGFSSVADSGNGNYTVIFTTPLQTSDPVVTVRASKNGFNSGQGQTTVVVSGIPNLTTLKVVGIPFFLIAAGVAILVLLILAMFVRKKKSEYRYTPARHQFQY